MATLRGKVVVVTGAASGIGRATATAFAREGARVHAVDLSAERLADLQQSLSGSPLPLTIHVVDCTDATAVAALAAAVLAQDGRIDVLHNNAGVGHGAPVRETSLEDWRWVIDTNLWSVIHGVHAFVPAMISQGSGHIVNTASMAGLIGLPKMAPYCTSKFAVVGLSESLGAELAPFGIHVTAVCPGLVRTGIVRSGRVGHDDAFKQGIEAFYERFGASPEQVAKDVLAAVRRPCAVRLSAPMVTPLWMLKRVSTDLYQRVIRVVAPAMMGG